MFPQWETFETTQGEFGNIEERSFGNPRAFLREPTSVSAETASGNYGVHKKEPPHYIKPARNKKLRKKEFSL
ncbi:hypothetical protein HMPREF1981_00853 [Bacteroides pyogenes F0041]|uniref:Uncharacterized protein n=1 Tax=Bacteroides pyogenes F0041 TaxID=1321819 RepID=U2DY51_9BACE|nr:hypothetical protein HMPREF1981_00853 [Bacteroides pyogenes F0041]